LEKVLKENDLPHWAYGPTPIPVKKLIHEIGLEHEQELEDKISDYASDRIQSMITCLKQCKEISIEKYTTLMAETDNVADNGHLN